MRNLIKEFVSTIYNPSFYKQIGNKSLKSIFTYMLKVDLTVSIIAAVAMIIYLSLNLNQLGDVSSSVIAVSYVTLTLTAFITAFLTMVLANLRKS